MKRFRVVKAAHLAVGAAAVLLLAVIIALAIRYVKTADEAQPAGVTESIGYFATEAAQAAFAASEMEIEILPAVQTAVLPEDEHTDATVAAPTPQFQPSVLIYHTHTHEAYQPTADTRYKEANDHWRTQDERYNVVRVGDALAEALTARGIRVVHDRTDHELDEFETSYERSLQTLSRYEEDFDLYIDLHRDAYGSDPEDAVTVSVGQKTAAKLMLLVGTGDGFNVKPDSAENYKFAIEVTDAVNSLAPGLCRDVLVKSKRYNQHVGRCMLLEVGHNLNTLDQALEAIPYFAEALADVLQSEGENKVVTLQHE